MQDVVMFSEQAALMHELKYVNHMATTSLLMGALSTIALVKPLQWHKR